jgi:transposase-like protein
MPRQREMLLVNKESGEMVCRHCGSRHFATIANSKFKRSSWKCKNPDCLPKRLREAKAKIEFKTAVGEKPQENINEYRIGTQD